MSVQEPQKALPRIVLSDLPPAIQKKLAAYARYQGDVPAAAIIDGILGAGNQGIQNALAAWETIKEGILRELPTSIKAELTTYAANIADARKGDGSHTTAVSVMDEVLSGGKQGVRELLDKLGCERSPQPKPRF